MGRATRWTATLLLLILATGARAQGLERAFEDVELILRIKLPD